MPKLVIWSALLVRATAVTAAAAALELKTEEQTTLYALGLAISRSLSPYDLTGEELEIVEAGLADGSRHRPSKVDLETSGPRVRQFLEQRAAAAAARKDGEPGLPRPGGRGVGSDQDPIRPDHGPARAGDGSVALGDRHGDSELRGKGSPTTRSSTALVSVARPRRFR